MPRRIDLSRLSYKERQRYLDGRRRAKKRRRKNAIDNSCINENKKRTHGIATHGVRCKACHRVHSGKVTPRSVATPTQPTPNDPFYLSERNLGAL